MSKLKPLEFSLPKPRYETIAEHVNDKGQKFIVKVSSDDESVLNEYIKNVQADLEYVSENVNIAPNLETENTFIEEETATDIAENKSKNTIAIVIEAVKSVEMEQTKFVSFRLATKEGRTIEPEDGPQNATVYPMAGRNTNITVKRGQVLATLLKNGIPISLPKKIAAGQTKSLSISGNISKNDKYTVQILGQGDSNEYEISGNATVLG